MCDSCSVFHLHFCVYVKYMSVHVIIAILFHLPSASFVLFDYKISKLNKRLLEISINLKPFKGK